MIEDCPFFEIGESSEDLRCAAGVNFASVGPRRSRCLVCKLDDLGDSFLCPNIDIYTFHEHSENGWVVRARIDCLADNIPVEMRCLQCPLHRPLFLRETPTNMNEF